jgi:hypothetical protein
MMRKQPIPKYFSRAKSEFVEKPSVRPDPAIVAKFQDDRGDVKSLRNEIRETKQQEPDPPEKKKKRLPGERLLMKLTQTKGKDRRMERIQRSISKLDFPNIYNLNARELP